MICKTVVIHTMAVSCVAALCVAASPTAAQDLTAPNTATAVAFEAAADRGTAAPKQMEREDQRVVKRDPLVRSGLSVPEPQLTLETTRANGRATGSIGLVKAQTAGETSFLLSMSSPIGSSADAEAHPIDLRGLTNGSSVTVGFNSARMFRTFSVSDIVRLCSGLQKEECTAGKLEENGSPLSQRLLDKVFKRVPVVFGASVTYGRNKFSFFDASGTRQPAVGKTDLEAEASLGLMVNGRRNLLAFHVAYSDTNSPSPDKTQLCRPLAGSTVARCDAAVMGAPVNEKSVIATIEYRWQAALGDVPVAFAPKFQYAVGMDDTEDLKSLEVPIYFFQERGASKAPKLTGGVSAGWRSDTGFQAYVFIGAAFKLFEL